MTAPLRDGVRSRAWADASAEVVRYALRDGDAAAAHHAAMLWLSTGRTCVELYGEVVEPLLDRLGERWAAGELSVAEEHVTSEAVLGLVQRLRAGIPDPASPRGRVVLVAGAGERHQIGMAMLAHVLTERGWAVSSPGELPWAEVGPYVGSLQFAPAVDVVGLSLHDAGRRAEIARGISRIKAEVGRVPVVLGGLAVRTSPGLPAEVGADGGAGSLEDAVRVIEGMANPLTPRECDVLGLLAEGQSNLEIAGSLGIALSTVKGHLERLGVKAGRSDRAAIVAVGLRRGWIS